jgi:hypothetical protein
MNANVKIEGEHAALVKADPASSCLKALDRTTIAIKAGTSFNGFTFADDTPLEMPKPGLVAGCDYAVLIDASSIDVRPLDDVPGSTLVLGGFHFAPGGNAAARAGGDDIPAINPCSVWDLNFRPACADPRGMALEIKARAPFWYDIYFLGVDHHINGTSRFGVIIADGRNPPVNPATGKPFKRLDYATSVKVMAHHGKGLMSFEEFSWAAHGVTEKTIFSSNPKVTGLDAPRTSQSGMMQASGNKWAWGHNGDPDEPRPSVFGGSWVDDGNAGSRFALVDNWAGNSRDHLGARGRSDHLQLG